MVECVAWKVSGTILSQEKAMKFIAGMSNRLLTYKKKTKSLNV